MTKILLMNHLLLIVAVIALTCGGSARFGAAAPEVGPTTPKPANTSSSSPAPTSSSTTTTTTTATTDSSNTTTTTTPTPSPASTSAAPKPVNPNCPQPCECARLIIDCSSQGLTQVPKIDPKTLKPGTTLELSNNSLTSFDFKTLINLEMIMNVDLSLNQLKSLTPPKRNSELLGLRNLDLSNNQLVSLANFSQWKMPNLQKLTLSWNPLVDIEANAFANKLSILNLQMEHLPALKSIDERAFAPLSQLRVLEMAGSLKKISHLPNQLFANISKLELLDLSRNQLLEVPVALRSARDIRDLRLDSNEFSSLRPSDFVNRSTLRLLSISSCSSLTEVDANTFAQMESLTYLKMTNNVRLGEISPLAFARKDGDSAAAAAAAGPGINLKSLELSSNNLTTLASISDAMPGLNSVKRLELWDNPWDCSCDIKWMLLDQRLAEGVPMHCETPAKFKDMEISQVLKKIDCSNAPSVGGDGESMMQRFVLVVFLLFLVVLTVAVFVQRADICRRLQWRDQYGTIYYTKASFPSEQQV